MIAGLVMIQATHVIEPDLYSLSGRHNIIYVNQPAVAICQTRGSQALIWRSPDLLDKQIVTFTSDDEAGTLHLFESDIEAILVSVDTTSDEPVIVSRFQFIAKPSYNNITIYCLNADLGTSSNITFHVNGRHTLYI